MIQQPLRFGALFAGYGGLEIGVQSVLGGEVLWHCEVEDAPSRILAHHWPDVPNLGDITQIDWHKVAPVDVLTGGYPCQPFSLAGRRDGVADRRHLWPHVADGISVLRPRLCVFENVRGHLTLGFDEVLRDLHQLGYRASWMLVRASEVGAPHARARIFIFAERGRHDAGICGRTDRRRGVYRDSRGWRNLPGAAQGQHDGQGAPCAQGDEAHVWRKGREGQGCPRPMPRGVDVEADRRDGSSRNPGSAPTSAGQGRVGGRGPGISSDAGVGRTSIVAITGVDARDARPGKDAPSQDPGGEQEGAGSGTSNSPAGEDATGGLPLGLVVGAERRSDGAGRVRREDPIDGADGGGAPIRDGAARYRVFVFAAPADTEDVGHERGRGTRPGRTGPENGGDAPADASRIGWDQWRPESAGIVRGLDAPERGSPHVPDTEGHSRRVRDGDGRAPADADSDAVRVEPVAVARGCGAPESGRGSEAPADAECRGRDGRSRDTLGGEVGRAAPARSGTGRRRREAVAGADDDGLVRLGRVDTGERDLDGRGREDPSRDDAEPTAWGPYAPAIDRWAAALGRPAPPPTELGPKGAPRLSPRFVEWLMGLPAGHVTDVPGISRNDQLKALGNGVVPEQAAAATRRWLNHYANA